MSHAFQLMELEAQEISMKEAFALALTNDTFHDVTLKGTDGVLVPANRTILGLRSLVFRKMLFGSFQEANQDIVHVDYPGEVAKAVVEYIHTDNTELLVELDDKVENSGEEIPNESSEKFGMLLTLTAAAAFYGLPKLCHKLHTILGSFLKALPFLAFPLLEACSQQGPAVSEKLKRSALLGITKLLEANRVGGISLDSFSECALELWLLHTKNAATQRTRFLLIDLWHRAGSDDQDRTSIAKKLVKENLELQLIDPDDLSDNVAASGLVDVEQLMEAYKWQAKRAKDDFHVSFSNWSYWCPNPSWKGTKSAAFSSLAIWMSDTLTCPIMQDGGKYTWTVKIEYGVNVWLGVVLSTVSDTMEGDDKYGGNIKGCYGYSCCTGVEWSNRKKGISLGEATKAKKGDIVTMTLDLSMEGERNGTLSVSVNNQQQVFIRYEMLAKLSAGEGNGFVPTVSCHASGVRIVCIEKC